MHARRHHPSSCSHDIGPSYRCQSGPLTPLTTDLTTDQRMGIPRQHSPVGSDSFSIPSIQSPKNNLDGTNVGDSRKITVDRLSKLFLFELWIIAHGFWTGTEVPSRFRVRFLYLTLASPYPLLGSTLVLSLFCHSFRLYFERLLWALTSSRPILDNAVVSHKCNALQAFNQNFEVLLAALPCS